MKFSTVAVAASFAVVVTACASAPSAAPAAQAGMAAHAGMHHHEGHGAMCPMKIAGTSVCADDVDGGAALVFTTTGDVAAVRARVQAMAEKHNTMHKDGAMAMPAEHMGAMHKMDKMAMMPAATARAEDIDGGARLLLSAAAPADVDALRAHVRDHASKAAAGECPMMHEDGAACDCD